MINPFFDKIEGELIDKGYPRNFDILEKIIFLAFSEYKNIDKFEDFVFYKDQISKLPDFLKKMTNLKYLRIPKNDLSELPDFIGDLVSLEYLRINRNKSLTELPESIGNLVSLKKLSLGYNNISELPESIGNLVSLEELSLNHNKLTRLPESIGNLVSLKRLNLDDNKLTELPESIGNLVGLEVLFLFDNKFSRDYVKELKKNPSKYIDSVFLGGRFVVEINLVRLHKYLESSGNIAEANNLNLIIKHSSYLEKFEELHSIIPKGIYYVVEYVRDAIISPFNIMLDELSILCLSISAASNEGKSIMREVRDFIANLEDLINFAIQGGSLLEQYEIIEVGAKEDFYQARERIRLLKIKMASKDLATGEWSYEFNSINSDFCNRIRKAIDSLVSTTDPETWSQVSITLFNALAEGLESLFE